MSNLNAAMTAIKKLNEAKGKGTVNLKGKTYTSVSTRVEVFRTHLGLEYGIQTELLFPVKGIVMVCRVVDKEGFQVGTGHAYADSIQKDKSFEKLESVAIGRAMASIGLAGGEYASDTEIESWQERYDEVKKIEKQEMTGVSKEDFDYCSNRIANSQDLDDLNTLAKPDKYTAKQAAENPDILKDLEDITKDREIRDKMDDPQKGRIKEEYVKRKAYFEKD